MAELGKNGGDMSRDDIEEVVEAVQKDSLNYTIDYDAYMRKLVVLDGMSFVVLNF